MNYYNEIKNELINNEVYKKVKDYSKNRNDLNTYYNVGKLLSEAGKHYSIVDSSDILYHRSRVCCNEHLRLFHKQRPEPIRFNHVYGTHRLDSVLVGEYVL